MTRQRAEPRFIEALRAKDSAAVAQLDTTYGSRMQQLALRYVKNHEDAEEVKQDALLHVINGIDAFRGEAALSSWIYRIVANIAMSRLRCKRFTRTFEVRSGDMGSGVSARSEPSDHAALADDIILQGQMRRQMGRALAQLPPIYRVPVVLRDVYGYSTTEAAVMLQVPPQTVKSRLHRGRVRLRRHLAEFRGAAAAPCRVA